MISCSLFLLAYEFNKWSVVSMPSNCTLCFSSTNFMRRENKNKASVSYFQTFSPCLWNSAQSLPINLQTEMISCILLCYFFSSSLINWIIYSKIMIILIYLECFNFLSWNLWRVADSGTTHQIWSLHSKLFFFCLNETSGFNISSFSSGSYTQGSVFLNLL